MEKPVNKKNNIFNICLSAFVLIVSFWLISIHEPWRDEAQSWLIARDTTLISLFGILKYEGHPALWYLILKPFAKTGAPYITINYISWLFASCGMLLFIFKAPFNKAVKIITALSPIFIYWLPVVARSYSVIMFFVFALAAIYKDRKEKAILYSILIALLVNTHILMAGFCGALLLNELIDILINLKQKKEVSKKQYIGFLIGFLGCLAMVIQMWGCIEQNGVVKIEFGEVNYGFKVYQNILLFTDHLFGVGNMYFKVFMLLLFIVFLLMIFVLLFKYFRQLLIFAFGIGFELAVIILLFVPSGQKSHLIILILLFIAWTLKTDTADKTYTSSDKDKVQLKLSTVVNILVCIILLSGYYSSYKDPILLDINGNFSSGKKTAEFLNKSTEPDSVIITIDDMVGPSIAVYLKNKKLWNMYNDTYSDFAILNVQRAYRMYDFEIYINELQKDPSGNDMPGVYKNSTANYLYNYASAHFSKDTVVYFVVSKLYYPRFDLEGLVPVFSSEECSYYSYIEGYKIYRLIV